MTQTPLHPDWDLDELFTGLDAADAFADALARDLDDPDLDPAGADLEYLEHLDARLQHLATYLGCRSAADARDEDVARARARLAELRARWRHVEAGLQSRLRGLDAAAFSSLAAGDRGHFLTRLRDAPAMDDARESLAADLEVTGKSAWSRLYDTVQGSLTFSLDDIQQPVAMTRTFLEDEHPAVRQAAFRASNEAWERAAPVLAHALNAIAGERLALNRHRGVDDFLAPALHDAAITRATLDAMLDAVRDRWDLPRAYLKAKAARMHKPALDFCDLLAPAPAKDSARVSWDEGTRLVLDSFASYPALKASAEEALARRWVDHTPRAGKRPGAFCATSRLARQSRVFLTFHGSFGDVRTLAHELGHAYHGAVLRGLPFWDTRYPMTLAETASTFAEQLLTDAMLARADDEGREAILDRRLTNASVYLLNTPMRFLFEERFYRQRQQGELSVAQLSALMEEAQREVYGDALDELDPLFWASKLHFFLSDVSFYNFPYTFGFLFSLGIFARYREEGAAFFPAYEALLKDTARASAEEVARRHLGVDLTRPDFWHASLDLVEEDWRAYSPQPI